MLLVLGFPASRQYHSPPPEGRGGAKLYSSEASSTRKLLIEKKVLVSLLATQSRIARDFGRDLRTASFGPLENMTGFNWVCEEGGR